jgi:[NiFe] hydrogenase assembly HybE family chaperone
MTAVGDRPVADEIGPRLVALWRVVALRMAGLPVYNEALTVQATAFRRHGAWAIGVVVTPWFMNVVAVPDDAAALPSPGACVSVAVPAGEIEAVVADLEGFGRLGLASLFSPMDAFDDPAVTEVTALAALDALFEAPGGAVVDRRRLFFGSRSA